MPSLFAGQWPQPAAQPESDFERSHGFNIRYANAVAAMATIANATYCWSTGDMSVWEIVNSKMLQGVNPLALVFILF